MLRLANERLTEPAPGSQHRLLSPGRMHFYRSLARAFLQKPIDPQPRFHSVLAYQVTPRRLLRALLRLDRKRHAH